MPLLMKVRNKMRTLSIFEPGKLAMEDLPRPKRGDGMAIVKIEMCGICGSDVTAFADPRTGT